MNDFLPLSDIQKRFTFTPIKTYRLFKKFAKQNKLQEEIDWLRQDNQIIIDTRKFYTLLEAHGYKDFLRDAPKRQEVKSDEINRNQVISNEITPEEKSDVSPSPEPEKVKSTDFNRNQMKSNDFTHDNMPPTENENSPEVISLYKEMIKTYRENAERAEREAETLREIVRNSSAQNTALTRQNVQLTHILTAPKQRDEREEEERESRQTYREAAREGEPIYAAAPERNAHREAPTAPEYSYRDADTDDNAVYENPSADDAFEEDDGRGEMREDAREERREGDSEDTREEPYSKMHNDAPSYHAEPNERRDQSFTPHIPTSSYADTNNENRPAENPVEEDATHEREHNAQQSDEQPEPPREPVAPVDPDIPRRIFITPPPSPPPTPSPQSTEREW